MRPSRSRFTAIVAALVLVASSVGSATAITWNAPVAVTTSGTGIALPGALVTWGTNGSLAAFTENDPSAIPRVYVRRSDGSLRRLSTQAAPAAYWPALANDGRTVHAVWTEHTSTTRVVKYRSSTDGGATWSSARTLSGGADLAGIPKISRNGAGQLAVVWTDQLTGRVRVRVSTDGGATFGTRTVLGTSSYRPWPDDQAVDAFAAVAVARGAVVVTYLKNASTLVARRSTNGGASWGAEQTLAADAFGSMPAAQAAGKTVVIGYARVSSGDVWAVARRSTDNGATWAKVRSIAAKSAPPSLEVVLSASGGVWRALYEQCKTSTCDGTNVLYRESTDGGITWSGQTKLNVGGAFNMVAGVAATTNGPRAVWTKANLEWTTFDVILRTAGGTSTGTTLVEPATGATSDSAPAPGGVETLRQRSVDRAAP